MASTLVTGGLNESQFTTPSHSCPTFLMLASDPRVIFAALSKATTWAPINDASMARLPVPANGSRKNSPSLHREKFTSALESLGKMAAGWKNGRRLGLRRDHPCFIPAGEVRAMYLRLPSTTVSSNAGFSRSTLTSSPRRTSSGSAGLFPVGREKERTLMGFPCTVSATSEGEETSRPTLFENAILEATRKGSAADSASSTPFSGDSNRDPGS